MAPFDPASAAVGGALMIGDTRFSLYLPPLGSPERSSGQGS